MMPLLKGVGLDEEQLDRTARLTGNECGDRIYGRGGST